MLIESRGVRRDGRRRWQTEERDGGWRSSGLVDMNAGNGMRVCRMEKVSRKETGRTQECFSDYSSGARG